MTCRVMGCSLCPHALFSQAWSHIYPVWENWSYCLFKSIEKCWSQVFSVLYIGSSPTCFIPIPYLPEHPLHKYKFPVILDSFIPWSGKLQKGRKIGARKECNRLLKNLKGRCRDGLGQVMGHFRSQNWLK